MPARPHAPPDIRLAVIHVAESVVGHGAYRLRFIAATTLSEYRTVAALRCHLTAAKLLPAKPTGKLLQP